MVMQQRDETCPAGCPGCPAPAGGVEPIARAVTAEGGHAAGNPLEGWRLVAAAGYVFGVPLAVLVAAETVLAGRFGELPALGLGLAAAAVLMAPACWLLRRRRPGREEVHP